MATLLIRWSMLLVWLFTGLLPVGGVTAEISLGREEVTQGEVFSWIVQVTTDEKIEQFSLENPAEENWTWVGTPVLLDRLEGSQILEVRAAARRSGRLTPMVQMHYKANGRWISTLVSASAVNVRPMEEMVSGQMIIARQNRYFGDRTIDLTLQFDNRSPFILTVSPQLPADRWIVESDIQKIDLAPGESHTWQMKIQPVHPNQTLLGEISYRWTDDIQNEQQKILLLDAGKMDSASLELPDWVTTLIAAIAGGVFTLLTSSWLDGQKRSRERQVSIRAGRLSVLALLEQLPSDLSQRNVLDPVKTIEKILEPQFQEVLLLEKLKEDLMHLRVVAQKCLDVRENGGNQPLAEYTTAWGKVNQKADALRARLEKS